MYEGDPALLVHLLLSASFSFLCRGKGPSRTRPLELARLVMDLAIALTRKTNPFHAKWNEVLRNGGKSDLYEEKTKVGPMMSQCVRSPDACLCFRGLASPVELTIARLISKRTWHSESALRRQRRPPRSITEEQLLPPCYACISTMAYIFRILLSLKARQLPHTIMI